MNSNVVLLDMKMDPNIMGVPIDYSFRKVSGVAQLENGTPREHRVGIPKRRNDKYVSSSVWINYNHLKDLDNINNLINISLYRPEMISWLDASFNEIETISPDLVSLQSLKILYLHANKIEQFQEVAKLKPLKKLRTLTLHGNPINEMANYRPTVLKLLPQLLKLDFTITY